MSGSNSSGSGTGASTGDGSSRNTTLIFEECHTRVQAVAELLFISCTPRPVFTTAADLTLSHDNFEGFRDRVIGQLNKMLLLSRDVATQAHSKQIHWKQLSQRVRELTSVVVSLLELSAHISYLMAVRDGEGQDGAALAVKGPVESVHRLTQADLDIRFSCQRLKRSRVNDLQPHLLVDLCTALTKSLSVMTEVCRHAAEEVHDSYDQDQFKLCVKTITSTVSCLVTSIKSFKRAPSDSLLRRVVTFCDPVISASAALLAFATEDCFTGCPAALTEHASEMYKACLGLSVSISSATIQMFRAVRDLVHASSSCKRHQDRLSLCVESLTRSSSQLRDMLLSHSFVPVLLHSSHPHSDLGLAQAQPVSGKDGGSSLNSVSCSSWEKVDTKKQHSTFGEIVDIGPITPIDSRQKQGRVSMSPQGSPKLSSRDGQLSNKQAQVKTPSKSSKRDKDGSRSPRTKEKRHKSSSSTSSSSSSSHHHHHHHHSQHASHGDKDKLFEGHRGDMKHPSHKASNQEQQGEDNSGEENQRQHRGSPSSERSSQGADFFFSQAESASHLLSSSSSSLPPQPGSRPTSMEVDAVLASLAPDSPGARCSMDEAGYETLAGLRELHIEGPGPEDIGEVTEERNSSRL